MTQHLFNGEGTSDKALLDANFSQLYDLREFISTPTYTAATPSVFLNVGGDTLFGTTVSSTLTQSGTWIAQTYSAVGAAGMHTAHKSGTATGAVYASYGYNGTVIGSISQSGTTGVAYNTSSDYRLKSSVAPIAGSGAFIDALKPCTWTWISDGSAGAGFIAHEFQAVSPSSVTGAKDAVDAAGHPVYQAVGYASPELIANLVAEVKALRLRLHALDGG